MKTLKWILIFVAALIVLIPLFYLEEDWHGKNAWENCQRELKTKGETLDFNNFIPPAVPDSQNIYKAPNMTKWFILRNDSTTSNELVQCLANTNTTQKITTKIAAMNYLNWSDQFQPEFDEIGEALKRPNARIDGDYSVPFTFPLPNFQALRAFSQTLAQRAKCHLLLGQPDKALAELTLLNDSRHMFENPPFPKGITLVTAVLDVAVLGTYEDALGAGLQSHAWQEPQLIILQNQLKQINLSPFMVNAFREDRTVGYYVIKSMSIDKTDPNHWNFARGWFYQNLVKVAVWHQQIIESINLSDGTIAPEKVNQVENQMKSIKHFRPYTFYASIITPFFSKAMKTFAHDQTLANEAQVACALERYHLAHNTYPETLDTLGPQYMQTIPHDIIGGQPLHYRRTNDGKFLLYSVGWNEKDDGGIPSPHDDTGNVTNYDTGDWVWPN